MLLAPHDFSLSHCHTVTREIPGNESGHPIAMEGTYKEEKEGAQPQI
jgi:hypothetical protein